MFRPRSMALRLVAISVGFSLVFAPLFHTRAYDLAGADAQGYPLGPGFGPVPAGYPPGSPEYLLEIGVGTEYGRPTQLLHKWTEDVKIKVYGAPTDADISTLHQVVGELNDLLDTVELQVTSGHGNLEIYFLPEPQFASVEPKYVPVNLGFFRVWWDNLGEIHRARVLIASQGVTQRERSHLIREELTQSLGLFRDSWRYPDSIFYQGWTDTIQYSELDRAVISMLYELPPGSPVPGRDHAKAAEVRRVWRRG